MSLMFLLLKASHIWDTPYDGWLAFVLVDLDVIVGCEVRRLWLHARGR